MADPVTITLLGEPVAWRHRTSPDGRHRYLPTKQRNISATLRLAAQDAMFIGGNYAVVRPVIDEPVRIELMAEFTIPDSWSKKKKAAAIRQEILPGKRPDLSNTLKLIEDSLNGIVFRDDCLICEMHCRKRYSVQPKITITIEPINATLQLE